MSRNSMAARSRRAARRAEALRVEITEVLRSDRGAAVKDLMVRELEKQITLEMERAS